MKNSFYKSKSFRYGSAATAFTCAFIAVVIVFNIIFTALASRYMWYIDMTKEEVFTLSEAAKEILSDIDDEVNIYFTSEPDERLQEHLDEVRLQYRAPAGGGVSEHPCDVQGHHQEPRVL